MYSLFEFITFLVFFLGRGEGGVGGERCGGWWSGFVIRKPTSFS